MSKRGRKPSNISKVSYKVMIPEELMAEIQLLLLDPFTGKIKFGAFTQLTEKLLRDWVEAQKKEKSNGTA